MSLYNFIASDRQMDDYCFGIEHVKGNMIVIPDETRTLNIFAEDDCTYSSVYTKWPFVACVELSKFEKISAIFFEYITEQMKTHKFLELWTTWLDEVEEAEHRAVNVVDFTVQDLEWIYGQEFYTNPKCLKIYKWMK